MRTSEFDEPLDPGRLAAMIVVATGLAIVLNRGISHTPSPTGTGPDSGPAAVATLATLHNLSAALETRLADVQGNVLNPRDPQSLLWIESELRLTDELIAEVPESLELWTRPAQPGPRDKQAMI